MQYVDPEVVICAAVVSEGEVVIRCHRHHDGLRALEERGLRQMPNSTAQGFITSRGRYVDRAEGLRLQLAARVPSADPRGYRGDRLYSEDLY